MEQETEYHIIEVNIDIWSVLTLQSIAFPLFSMKIQPFHVADQEMETVWPTSSVHVCSSAEVLLLE